jgi:hypothetical protein
MRMRNGLSWLTLGLTGLLLGAPSCGGDEATGDGGSQAVDLCQVCEASGQCRRPDACIELEGNDGIGVCAPLGATQCCTADNKVCRDNLSGDRVEDSGSGGSSSGGSTGKGGSGGSILGGSSGSAGKGGSSGSSGSSGNNTTALGAACQSDADCNDDRLTCLTTLADGTSLPGGLCTLPCTSDGQCFEITDNTFCVGFSETETYCIESCLTGSGSGAVPKCHERDEVACTIIGLDTGAGGDECETSDDCPGEQLCSTDGVCGAIVTGCSPTCGADSQCAVGECDYRTGLCSEDKPSSLLPIGSRCTVPGEDDPEPCDGFCVPTEADSTDGECGAFCVATPTGVGCGFDGSEPGEAACLFATIISPPDAEGGRDVGPNDVMLCGKLCDCNAQCPIADELCMDESEDGLIAAVFGRNGYCRGLIGSETEADSFDECPDGSSGGSGGMTGSAGAPPSEAGSGGESTIPPAAGQGGQGGA